MTQVLARKWRPRTFEQLVGQEHVVLALSNALRDQRLHHAYLFTGTRGVGKTTLARIIAKALNCETGVTAEPCGACKACQEIDTGRFIDLIELDAASNTQVDSMRELLENALYAPTSGRYKVYIIDEVHMLSRSAFNAMLKTLEEPPEHVKFVLATTDPQKIPVTVLSRCLQFNLKQIPQQQIVARLKTVLDAEGLPCEAPALTLIARAAQGSLRDALSLLDQAIAHGAGKVEEASTRAMLGAVDQSYLYRILKALAAGDGAALIAEANQMAERSLSFEMALQDLGVILHRLALIQRVPDAVPADDPERAALDALAPLFDAEELQLYYQIAVQGRNEIGWAPDEYAGFTMTLLRMLAFAPDRGGERGSAAVPPAARTRSATVAPGAAPEAAPAASAAAPAAGDRAADTQADSAQWASIIDDIGVNGMAKELARHCELTSHANGCMQLTVPKLHESLLHRSQQAQDRLKDALRKRYGADLKINIVVGEASGNSPKDIADREKQRRHAKAVADIEDDPFVRELVEDFDARVNESSIKPIQ
ncbi:MAG TPA: DNA polymerase III subunit gamma/tau [Burkholderiales bacterium]|nr:DNA polymerase III subunit gamma/tau [Burkholderiales bacterium]